MADILGIGTSGLLSFQRAMTTISHNISNVNTDGYSRQRTQLDTRQPQGFGNGFMGTGVDVSAVERLYDQFLVNQVRTQTTRSAELNSYYDMASRVDNLLSDTEAGISPMLQEFFNSVQGVADAPGSIPARQVMLTTAESLTERMQYMYSALDSLNQSMNIDIRNTIDEVNGLASAIADLNSTIVLQSQRFGQPPNDLLDQRDEMLRQLSEHIAVTAVPQDDGALNVFIGNGQTLVAGQNASQLRVSENQFDPEEIAIELTNSIKSSSGVDVTSLLTGGTLGGFFRFKDEILDPAINQLGRVAIGLAETFNAQHMQGLTLNDKLGAEFFTDFSSAGSVSVYNSDSNSANGLLQDAVTATLTDASKLTAKDYLFKYDGTNYTVYSLPDEVNVGTFAAGAVPQTITVADGLDEGFSITVNQVLSAGDSFEIRPTRTAARDIAVQIDDVSDIAAAGAVRAYDSAANRGNATVTPGERITDTADPNYVTDAVFNTVGSFSVVFSASNPANEPDVDQYAIYDSGGALVSGPTAYTPGVDTTIGHSGMQFTISGTPLSGDTFTLERNVGATSDNRNALGLAALQSERTLIDGGAGPTMDFQSAYGQLVSMVGTRTHQADVAGTAQESLLNQAIASREAVSGVNLDEEAANLLKFQQAYQATARVITTAQTLFQSLLDAVR